ncbi:MAG TPA: malto-oligosyltrehalose synthase, partial [Chloroflexota bacterium]
FSGHGSALAQAYNHMIMPLAHPRDKYTQVLWGIRDFQHRFGRRPEGLWLPETAVDLETLDIMAAMGIRFTILAPHQAQRVRKMGSRAWRDVAGARIDPSMPYRLRLPSGRTIDLFFYDGPISRAVAFEGLLANGETFARRLLSGFSDSRSWPQLMHIATDGETYGHHHRHGDMALAYALHHLESERLARITNYGEHLERFPPTHEVEIFEGSSWSCIHGVERWKSDCGCNSGMHGGWRQTWRAPLRQALDWLRDTLAPLYEERASTLLKDPWQARNEFIAVVLERTPDNVDRFFADHARTPLDQRQRVEALKLLELQRHAMLMYTSCGWFFDEISGIETVQVLQYAGRAIQLAREVLDRDLEGDFLGMLERAESNIPEHRNGAHVYEKFVKPAMVDLEKVGAHYAISSLFESYPDRADVSCYVVDRTHQHTLQAGKARLALGRATVTSRVTEESLAIVFGAVYFGDHAVNGGVKPFRDEASYQALLQEASEAFDRADLPQVLRVLDRHFDGATYSLKSLFRDEQRKILTPIVEATLAEAEAVYRQIYEHQAPLMRHLEELGMPVPRAFHTAAEVVLSTELRRASQQDDLDVDRIRRLLEEARRWNVALDQAGLGYILKQRMERMMERFQATVTDLPLLLKVEATADLIRAFALNVDLWKVQNIYYDLLQSVRSRLWKIVARQSETASTWLTHFTALGEKLGVRVEGTSLNEVHAAPTVAAVADEVAASLRIPSATYRLQLNAGFTFQDAEAIVPYLDDLGVTDCYLSPILKARPGSGHGYDICDHGEINPELGGSEALDRLASTLRARGMGIVLDTVPNHMAITDVGNAWWMDVLENGPGSTYAPYFDIDWRPATPELENKVLLPFLEDQYGNVLENGTLRVAYEDGAFFLYYHEMRLPLAPGTYTALLGHQLESLLARLGDDHEHVQELQSILTALSYLPDRTETAPERVAERNREKEVIKRRIAALYNASPEIRAAIDAAVHAFNGTVGDPESFHLLDALLDQQAYRLAFWRVATDEINYRRFFDISHLAAIRVEVPEVFRDTHDLILRLVAEGKVTGLRIDHPDGLWKPASYFRQLQEAYLVKRVFDRLAPVEANGERPLESVLQHPVATWLASRSQPPGASRPSWPLYVVAEKILCEGEPLPEDWAIYGTTGYDFLNDLNGLFVDSRNRGAFDEIYSRFVGVRYNYRNLVNSAKKMIMLVSLASEVNALSHQLERIVKRNRRYRDFTLNSLTFALREVIACLPVYRTYIDGDARVVPERDQAYIAAAVAEAKKRNPRTAEAIFDFIGETLLLRNLDQFRPEDRRPIVEFVMKFQQVTGPVMAKGVEDTAFYVYNRLVSLNEVGGNPEQFGLSPAAFHQQSLQRQRRWPHSLLATSTHDTKRSEDVRARINALSEMPEEWQAALDRWADTNAAKKVVVDGEMAPDRNDEYLLYQTLLGVWPSEPLTPEEFACFRQRIADYMHKATKEAKVHTSWVNPNEAYDAAVRSFVFNILPDDPQDAFLQDFLAVQRRVAFFGRLNSLAQVTLKLTAPGVPDLYQGTELWDFSLVDPDNRRPVDFERRRLLLGQIRERVERDGDLTRLVRELLEHAHDGRIKLYVTHRLLRYRRDRRDLFSKGEY